MIRKFTAAFMAMMILLMLAPSSAFAAEPSVREVEALIAQIGTVTRENRSAVERAVDAYSRLDDAAKAEVSNFKVLAEAQQILGIKDALTKLNIEYDYVENDYTISSPQALKELDEGNCNVNPVMYVNNDGVPWLAIVYHYVGDEFIWMDSVVVRTDENKYTYEQGAFYYSHMESVRVRSGKMKCMEIAAVIVEDFDIGLLRDVSRAEKTVIRFKGKAPSGNVTQYDYVLTQENWQEITDVLNAYDLMCAASPEVLYKALA